MNGFDPRSQERLERVRSWRNRDRAAEPIALEMQHLQRRIESSGRRVAEFISQWEQVIPPALVEKTRVQGSRGGVFHVVVDSSAALYEIDRILREGGLARIRASVRGTLVRVKLAIGHLNSPESRRQ